MDFSKGCYLGQELVARIDSRGHVNKRLGGVLIAGSVVPSTGCELIVAGRSVGVLTSAAWSSERSCVVALAMVRTEVMPGSEVEVDGAVGTIVDLPMTW